jgi:hypothetical protein
MSGRGARLAETLVSFFWQRPVVLVRLLFGVVGNGSLVRLGMVDGTLLGPEGTTRVCVVVFSDACGGPVRVCLGVPGTAWSCIPSAVAGSGVGRVGCGLVVG